MEIDAVVVTVGIMRQPSPQKSVKAMTHNLPWFPQTCCVERKQNDKRTPGLFKTEWEGDEMISLNSKSYMGGGAETKTSCKG